MDEILIEKVKEHEVIYNVKSSDYRDQHIRQAAWESIGKELNISAIKAKERWENLRRCFCNAKNRRRFVRKGGLSSKKKKKHIWKYEQQMEFLIPFIESRKTLNNVKESQMSCLNLITESEEILSEGSDTEDTPVFDIELETFNLDAEKNEGAQSNLCVIEEVASISKDRVGKRYKVSKRLQNKKCQKSSATPAYEKVPLTKDNSRVRKPKCEDRCKAQPLSQTINLSLLETLDEMDMFFLSMSAMTKRLPKVDQAKIKLEVSNAVMLIELRNERALCSPFPLHQSSDSSPSPHPSNMQSMT